MSAHGARAASDRAPSRPVHRKPPHVVHASRGRVRIHFPSIRHHPQLAAELERLASSVLGVHDAHADPMTGNLLVVYDPGNADVPLTLASQVGDLLELPDVDEFAVAVDALREAHEAAGQGMSQESFEAALRRLPLAFLTIGLGMLVLTRGRRLPEWYDFLWFGLATYLAVNRPHGHPQNA